MKILVDTNVILDVLCNRPEFIEASSKVWKYCEVDQIEGYISALSVPNIVYILRKELTPQKTEQLIQQITMIFKVVDLKSTDLKAAAKMLSSDYEDAIYPAGFRVRGTDEYYSVLRPVYRSNTECYHHCTGRPD